MELPDDLDRFGLGACPDRGKCRSAQTGQPNPYCALACAELLYQAGLPRELYAIVPGPGSVVGTAIIDRCDYLMFTGSTGKRAESWPNMPGVG